MPASLKDRLEADQPSGSGQKYYNNHRGRGAYTKYGRVHSNTFKPRPFRPAVKEEPVESAASLLSRIQPPSPPSLLLRLSPERKRVEVSTDEEEGDVKEKVVDLQSGRGTLAEMPGHVAETAAGPKAYTRPNTQHEQSTDSPEPVPTMSASDAATDRLAEELIASALEEGKRLFADATRSLDVPVPDEPRSPASEAAVDDMLGACSGSNSSPPPGGALPEPTTPVSQAKPPSTPVSPSSLVVEQAKSILLPLIMQNVRARDPTADIEKIKERALSLLTDTECGELMQLASRMHREQMGVQATTKGGGKLETTRKVRGESQSPMGFSSNPLDGKSREEEPTRDNRSPTNKNTSGLLSAHSGLPGASTTQRQVICRSRDVQRSLSASSPEKSPPKASRAILETSSCVATTRIFPSTQGNYFTAGPSNSKSGSPVSPTPQISQDALVGSLNTTQIATQQATKSSPPHTAGEPSSQPMSSSPSKPASPPDLASEADVDMELSSDEDSDNSQSKVSGVGHCPVNSADLESQVGGSAIRPGDAPAPAKTWSEVEDALAAKAKAAREAEDDRRGSESSISSTPTQLQTGNERSLQSDEETDIGSSPSQPAPQPPTTEVLPELILEASASSHSTGSGTVLETPTAVTATGGEDNQNAASNDASAANATATVDDVRREGTPPDDTPPGLSSSDSRKRKLTESSSPPQKRRALSRDIDHESSGDKVLPDEQDMLVEESEDKETKVSEPNSPGAQEELKIEEQMDQEAGDALEAPMTVQQADGHVITEVSETQDLESKAAPPTEDSEQQPVEDEQGTAMDVDKPEEVRVERASAPPESPTILHEKPEVPTDSSTPVADDQGPKFPDMQTEPQVAPPTDTIINTEQASAPAPGASTPQPTTPMPRLYFAHVGASNINTQNFTFTVDEETAAAARRWAERETHFDPSQLHVRFSLMCLPCAAAQAVSDRLDSTATPVDFTNALWGVTTKWPKCGFLLVILNPDDPTYRGVLLPEDLDADDGVGPIDISARIKPGENVVQLLVLSNQSDCLYALHAGVPPQENLDGQLDVHRWSQLGQQHRG